MVEVLKIALKSHSEDVWSIADSQGAFIMVGKWESQQLLPLLVYSVALRIGIKIPYWTLRAQIVLLLGDANLSFGIIVRSYKFIIRPIWYNFKW